MTKPKKPRTEAQREASRRNGARSSGPKTLKGKKTSRMNPLKHGAYATNPIVVTGALAERKGLYGRGLRAFLEAMRPCNAVAEQFAVRIYNDMIKLDRLDWYEALGIEHRAPEPDESYDDEAALKRLITDADVASTLAWDLAERAVRAAGGIDELTRSDWWFVGDLAGRTDAEVVAAAKILEADAVVPSGADPRDDDTDVPAEVQAARATVLTAIEARHGPLAAYLEDLAQRHEVSARIADEALQTWKPTPSPEEVAAEAAAQLINGGYFERLARPRSTIHRSLKTHWELFTQAQALGPVETHGDPHTDGEA